jgi:hypothetical protein
MDLPQYNKPNVLDESSMISKVNIFIVHNSLIIHALSQPYFGLSVSMKLTRPKVGTWSPLGLPKTQSSITGIKTPCIEVFFIPLERSWSLDV